MRRMLLPLVATVLGCKSYCVDTPLRVENQVAAVAATRALPDSAGSTLTLPAAAASPSVAQLGSLDLPVLWDLALANNPSLREAAAELEGALGRRIQAEKYPNPRAAYSQENLGTSVEPAGAVKLELTQEIITAGKRRLDMAIAAEGADEGSLALLARKFDVLTRIRRAYYEYLGALNTVRVNEDSVASLEQGLRITRRQVEEAKTRPRTDSLRIEALLEEARIRLASSRLNVNAAWQHLVSEVGVPELSHPEAPGDFPEQTPQWDLDAIARRVQ